MMHIIDKKQYSDLTTITIGMFDLYESVDDRIAFKDLLHRLFEQGQEILLFFRRIEDLTECDELPELKKKILACFNENGNEFKYLYQIDDDRFDAIGKITLKSNFANLIIDLWKYFYAFDFFVPINNLSFEEYEDYLEVKGVDDINGLKMVENQLSELICIKGLGADHLVITFRSDLDITGKLGL